jgi:DNA-binding PadR family transcriptional regulator
MNEYRHRGRGRHRGREGWWGGPRMRRGQIRIALLAALAEEPGHGYDVMQKLEDKSGGAWRPSPGSVYPT